MVDLSSLVDIGEKLGLIQALKGKLLRQPDPAADKLVTALEEIYKIYGSLEAELPQFLALSFDPSDPKSLKEEKARLIALEGGEIRARMGNVRGHCSKIGNIYSRYLNPWFDRVLPRSDAEVLAELFQSLDEFDGQMVVAIDQVADWLSREASAVLTLVDDEQYEKAQERIRIARRDVLPQRQGLAKAMRTLLDLQSEFIGLSGAL